MRTVEENNELRAITGIILHQLNGFYNGNSWVTGNLENKVFSLTQEVAFKKVPGHSHSIAQQVAHIIAWRNFVVQKLTGNDTFDIEDNSSADWPEPVDWEMLHKEFEIGNQKLLDAIKNFPVEKWHSIVPRRNYSFLYLANGVIEHDYYHGGQIGSALAAIKKMIE